MLTEPQRCLYGSLLPERDWVRCKERTVMFPQFPSPNHSLTSEEKLQFTDATLVFTGTRIIEVVQYLVPTFLVYGCPRSIRHPVSLHTLWLNPNPEISCPQGRTP